MARRAWTREAADFLAANYRHGSGILFSFGDLTGVLREAEFPCAKVCIGNGPAYLAAVMRPEMFLREEWALALSGDEVATAVQRADRRGRALSIAEADYREGSPGGGDLPAPMKIPFTKAHGARNDFLLTPREQVPAGADPAALARAICDRHTGVGADGWIVISRVE